MTAETFTLLLAVPDQATATFLADNLCADGFDVLPAHSAEHALKLAATQFPDIAVIDVDLAARGACHIVQSVRAADRAVAPLNADLPILTLGPAGDELCCLRAFDWGVDDHQAKPFSYPELRARLRALLRRATPRARTGLIRVGAVQIDPTARQVELHARPVELTAKEYALLRYLAAEPTRVFTKSELLRDLWGFHGVGCTRTLDSHACRLRSKLSPGGRFVVNVWGVGYRLVDATPTEQPT